MEISLIWKVYLLTRRTEAENEKVSKESLGKVDLARLEKLSILA